MVKKAKTRKVTAKKAKAGKPTAKKTRKQAAKKAGLRRSLASHPATMAMAARVDNCNKPPIKFIKQPDGSFLECFLKSDCTYGDCVPVAADQVPAALK
jgi:hypothetical protein